MHSPTPGHLHMLFPLTGMLFPKILVALTLLLQIFAQKKKSPLQKGLPWTPFVKVSASILGRQMTFPDFIIFSIRSCHHWTNYTTPD